VGATERAFVATPVPTAGARVIASPFQFWTTGEDNLRVVSVCSVTGVALKVQGRFIDPSGTIGAASYDHTPNSDRTAKTDEFPLGVGAVLNLVTFARTGSLQSGQCFVIVQLIRGRGAAAIVLGTLLQGYVTTTQALAWPGSPIVSSTEGEPAIRQIVGTAPAHGVGISESVPTGARWQLLTLLVNVTADVPPLTSTLNFQVFTPAAAAALSYPLQQSFTANPTAACHWLTGFSAADTAASGTPRTALPSPLLLPAGSSFVTTNFGTVQQSAPLYTVREWLEVP
jgi:hypothetical protein